MPVKIAVIVLLFVIIGSLGSALFYLLKDDRDSGRMIKALTVRIALSIAAFLLLIGGYLAGLIQPHGLTP
jgi:hypothetical protein